ncbi:MAG: aminotransferase class I/II-fold pyridoxal phosphate-dependent enzyme [Lachnospiraceae bacterium]|nr:aminotransferase class I/II-fold pyridoxal phosphate-dependent enzyme [Lachnospiraceae bacterium]
MIRHTDHFHGSDLETIEQLYGIKKEEILSFSANVNPLGISPKLKEYLPKELSCITAYPDREYTELRKTIGAYCGCDYENITVGNGTSELISLVISNRHPKRALIIGPTYSEYEREVSLSGGTSNYFPLSEENGFLLSIQELEKELLKDVELLILCNPNNPTSSAISRASMRTVLDICKRLGIFVMVDETYIEFAKNQAEIDLIPLTATYNNLLILRGVSKFFSAPGLRLGYAITGNKDLTELINSRKNPWTVNSLAETAGKLMFTDTDYMQKTRELIDTERTYVVKTLSASPDFQVYEPVANFVLVKIKKEDLDADILFDALIRQKMMIRNCSTFPFLNNKYFRICFMEHKDNKRLLQAIFETAEKH